MAVRVNASIVTFLKLHLKEEARFAAETEAPQSGTHFLLAPSLTDRVAKTRSCSDCFAIWSILNASEQRQAAQEVIQRTM